MWDEGLLAPVGGSCYQQSSGFEVGWVGEAVGAVRRRTWSRLFVPSMRPLEARSVWCQARISSDHAMKVSTVFTMRKSTHNSSTGLSNGHTRILANHMTIYPHHEVHLDWALYESAASTGIACRVHG